MKSSTVSVPDLADISAPKSFALNPVEVRLIARGSKESTSSGFYQAASQTQEISHR